MTIWSGSQEWPRGLSVSIKSLFVNSDFDPRGYSKPAYALMQTVCEDRFEQFGTAGNAPKIKPIGLSAMARFYL